MTDAYFQMMYLPRERRGHLHLLRRLVVDGMRIAGVGQIIAATQRDSALPEPVEFWIDPGQIESLVTVVSKAWVMLRDQRLGGHIHPLEATLVPHSVLHTKTGDVAHLLGTTGDIMLALEPWGRT